jgi:very-short-patch-repair endonuclease
MRRLLAERPADYIAPSSGLEARVARLARDAGVVLRRQVDSGGEDWIGRVDFRIEQTGKVIEVLSERYHRSRLDELADHSRFARLADAGFEVLTIWDSDVWERGAAVVDQIRSFSRGDPTP